MMPMFIERFLLLHHKKHISILQKQPFVIFSGRLFLRLEILLEVCSKAWRIHSVKRCFERTFRASIEKRPRPYHKKARQTTVRVP